MMARMIKPGDPYAKPPRVSDEALFGRKLTLDELNVRPEGTYDDDPRIDQDAVAQARELDDIDPDLGMSRQPRDD
jgi:hypothetical protein